MTNRELMIKQLQKRDDEVLMNLMCPYLPGDPKALCTDPDAADYHKDCMKCQREWLDSESTVA